MELKTDLCICGHDRQDHQHLLGTEIKYPCLKCRCPDFSASSPQEYMKLSKGKKIDTVRIMYE